jgi:hypothetical protein
LVVGSERHASVSAGERTVEVELQACAFCELLERINWLAWPRGEGLRGVAVKVFTAPSVAQVNFGCALAAALVKDTSGGVLPPLSSRAQAASEWANWPVRVEDLNPTLAGAPTERWWPKTIEA